MVRRVRHWVLAHPRAAAGAVLLCAAAAAGYWLATRPDPGDRRLAAFVRGRPPVPVVFTSRTEPTAFDAAAPEGEEFAYPGKRLWAAREGRLRVLTPHGTVHELTWGKPLPDGGTLVDVMSPSVSLDGKRILFAGRRGDGHGHFRLYEVNLDGTGLRPLTGGPDDPGAAAAPPMRFGPDGSPLPEAERRRVDYDDVDPAEVNDDPRQIAFATSRTPDLGRDHARRATTLWLLRDTGVMAPATANRNNDRWPVLLPSGYVGFSLWSRNREVVAADETDIRPYDPAVPSATNPADNWLGAILRIGSSPHFGMLVKPEVPVWRPRPLFNGWLTFMTAAPGGGLTAVQAPPGLISYVAAARPVGSEMPALEGVRLRPGPDRDADGRPLWVATPSACPPAGVLLAAAPVEPGRSSPEPARYGIYLAPDDWPDPDAAGPSSGVEARLLFDDPDLVDAEPVAAYPRKVTTPVAAAPVAPPPDVELKLAGGRLYRGPAAPVMITGLHASLMEKVPGQRTDTGEGPVFGPSPVGTLAKIKVYAARRDRFDDPARPRVRGEWELLAEFGGADPGGASGGPLPTADPTVLAAFDKDGKVLKWTTAAKDSRGRRATFYGYAGDHYSLATPGVRTFCVGCHPGHSGTSPEAYQRHPERVAER